MVEKVCELGWEKPNVQVIYDNPCALKIMRILPTTLGQNIFPCNTIL